MSATVFTLYAVFVCAQLLVSETSAPTLKMISSQVASFRRITQLELDVSLMAELEEILEKLRRCLKPVVCANI